MASIGADPSRGKMFITKIDILRGPPLLSGETYGAQSVKYVNAVWRPLRCPKTTLNGCLCISKAFLFKSH